jgi:hypothetical protein
MISLQLGASQSTTGLTNLVSNYVVTNQQYVPISTIFSVSTTGIYYVAIKGESRFNFGCCDSLLSLDDLSIIMPCCCNSPTVTIGSSTNAVCQGEQATLFGSGADTYTWSTGAVNPTITVNPFMTSSYQVTGKRTLSGCTATAGLQLQVHPKPNVFLTSPQNTICSGTSLTLMAFGANSYSWSANSFGTNAITVSPLSSTTYSVVGANNYGCKDTAAIHISVLPNPQLFVATSQDSICQGQIVNLMVLGAQSYTWTDGTNSFLGSTVQVNPASSTVYTVTGSDSFGCSSSVALVQTVLNCAFEIETKGNVGLNVFPNPVGDFLKIELDSENNSRISVMDASGKCLEVTEINGLNGKLDFRKFDQGLYFLKIETEDSIEILKIIKD